MIRPTMLVISALVLLVPGSGISAEGQARNVDGVDANGVGPGKLIKMPGTKQAIPGPLRYRQGATSSLGEKDLRLEQALIHEEGIDLNAAMDIYEQIINGFDKRRAGAAYAIFRLGECYRKQDKPEKAATQYRRILDEFSDQRRLAELSHKRLEQLGEKVPLLGPLD